MTASEARQKSWKYFMRHQIKASKAKRRRLRKDIRLCNRLIRHCVKKGEDNAYFYSEFDKNSIYIEKMVEYYEERGYTVDVWRYSSEYPTYQANMQSQLVIYWRECSEEE